LNKLLIFYVNTLEINQINMKLLIFGSTGSVGRLIVEQALEKGHSVTAFTRNPSKLDIKHNNLKVIQGDVLDLASVEKAMQGQDAVLAALGSSLFGDNNVRSEGNRQIIVAMEKNGVRRLITLSTLGAGDSRVALPVKYKILFGTILRKAFVAHEEQENFIKQSNLEWTIVRPGAYTNGNHTGKYRHGFPVTDRSITAKISRADVADFVLKQLTDNTYIRKTPGLSY